MLMNARTGDVVANTVEIADTRATRRRGLLGRDSMPASSALIIRPCFSIHTAFMRFAIDAVFVNHDGVVVAVKRNLAPWRIAANVRAHAVVELPAGSLKDGDVCKGDRLYLAAQRAAAGATVSWPIPA